MAGDKPALDTLWRSSRHWVAAVILAHIPRTAELEDLLQDVAMKMVSRIHTLKTPESFLPWLRTVARNVSVSAGRRAQVRKGQASLPGPDLVDPAHERARRHEPVQDLLEHMLGIVQKLHLDYREPLLMRSVQGMSQREIATALDLPVTTIETRLARARRLLAKEAQQLSSPMNGEPR